MLFANYLERSITMFKEQLLDYQTEKEYLLLRILYINNYKLDKNTICKKLGISYPTLKRIVERTNDYLKSYYPEENLLLISKTHVICFQNIPNIPVDHLTYSFFIHSDKYKLIDMLYKQPYLSRASIADNMNISATSLNILITQCNNFLKEFNLRIRNGKIEGNIFQYLYFYFLFYWSTDSNPLYKSEDLTNYAIDNFILETYKENIGPIEQKKLALWLILLREKKRRLNQNIINRLSFSYIPNVQDTKLFQDLKIFFKKHWKEITCEEIDNVAYITFLFFNSFKILDSATINLYSVHINDKRNLLVSKILILLQKRFHMDNLYDKIHTSLFYLLGKLLFFKGNIFSIDRITLNSYLDQYKTPFEEKIVANILRNEPILEKEFNSFQLNYFKYILYSIIFTLKKYNRKNINIALLLDTSPFLANAFSTRLNELFYNNQSVHIDEYSSNQKYDLIITNKYNGTLDTDKYFFISNLGSQIDLKKIRSIVEQLSLNLSL